MVGSYMLGTGLSARKERNVLTIVFQMSGRLNLSNRYDFMIYDSGAKISWNMIEAFLNEILFREMTYASGMVVEFSGVETYADVNLMIRISGYVKSRMSAEEHLSGKKYWFRFRAGWEGFQLEEVWNYLNRNEKNIEVEIVLDNFPEIKDSVLALWEKGIAEVFVRMKVAEEEKEERILEEQLKALADYALDNQLFRRCRCNFFEEEIAWNMGAGVVPKRARPFPASLGDYGMHTDYGLRLAEIRANEYYFAQLWERYKIRRNRSPKLERLFIPLAEHYLSWNHYKNENRSRELLKYGQLEGALRYCEENGMEAVLVHPWDELLGVKSPRLHRMRSVHYVAAAFYREATVKYENVAPVFESGSVGMDIGMCPVCILNVEQKDISCLADMVKSLLKKADRIEINILGTDRNFGKVLCQEQMLVIEKMLRWEPGKEVRMVT